MLGSWSIFILCLTTLRVVDTTNKVRYASTEHPEVTWFNPKYLRFVNMTAQRYSRSDPFYYVGLHVDTIWPIYHNVNVHFVFYEFLSNQYKRSFVELHFEVCEMIAKDLFLGVSIKQFFPHLCPLKAGVYRMSNITMPVKNIPVNFPFSKGRVHVNWTSRYTRELLWHGHIDLEIKEISAQRVKNWN